MFGGTLHAQSSEHDEQNGGSISRITSSIQKDGGEADYTKLNDFEMLREELEDIDLDQMVEQAMAKSDKFSRRTKSIHMTTNWIDLIVRRFILQISLFLFLEVKF